MNLLKKIILNPAIMALWLAFHLNGFAQQTAILTEIDFKSTILNQNRPVYIYTPSQYNERDLVSFDVVYVFDAQNRELFDLVHSSLNFIFFKKNFIVVGIASPSYEDLKYYRNCDYLPKPINVPIEEYQTDKPNAENFWSYFKDEIIPYINKNYRTTNVNYLVGHSLSASFVLDKAINTPELFKGFICVSPNLSYDKNRLADNFLKIDVKKPTEKKFLYLSQSNEPKTFAKPWGDAFYKVKNFINTNKNFGNYEVNTKEFPEYNHWNGFLPSLTEGLNSLNNFIDNNPYTLNGSAKEITCTVTVPNKNDEIYITGNQESLGSWNPSKVKLNKVSDYQREITLNVKFPIEFKITKGSWKSEGFTNQTTSSGENIVINNPKTDNLNIKVNDWAE